MGEVDDVQHAVDQRQADGDQHIDAAGQQAVQHAGEDDLRIEHASRLSAGAIPHPEEAAAGRAARRRLGNDTIALECRPQRCLGARRVERLAHQITELN